MKFSDIIGQEKIKSQLIRNVKDGRIAHAQIFYGETGYGSLSLSLAYSQYILCENRSENDSCGVCPSCYKISQLQHPDLHLSFPVNKSKFTQMTSSDGDIISDSLIHKWREIFLSSTPNGYFTENDWYNFIELSKNNQGNIGRHEANDIIKKLSFKSFSGGYKIVIMWLVERMNDSAANTLLKQFEEPEDNTLFIFISENKENILKTILSRSQILNIPPIVINNVNNYLKEAGVSNQTADVVSKLSQGNILTAKQLILSIDDNNEYFDIFTSLMRCCFLVDYLGLISISDNISTLGREQQKEFFEYSLKILRDSYMTSIGMSRISYTYGYESEFIKKFYPYVHHKNIELLITEFEKAAYDLSRNGNVKIVLTHFVLSISKLIKRL